MLKKLCASIIFAENSSFYYVKCMLSTPKMCYLHRNLTWNFSPCVTGCVMVPSSCFVSPQIPDPPTSPGSSALTPAPAVRSSQACTLVPQPSLPTPESPSSCSSPLSTPSLDQPIIHNTPRNYSGDAQGSPQASSLDNDSPNSVPTTSSRSPADFPAPPASPVPPHDDEAEDLQLDSLLLEKFLAADQSAPAPPPCSCHDLPIGSCPEIKNDYVNTISRLKSVPGSPANMDSLRIPLPRPSLPLAAWQFALQGYFDASEILAMLQYGWDISFLSTPNSLDAPKNLGSANIAPHDIDTYVETELSHGALISPFSPGELPWPVFHSPIGTVHKVLVRRTIVDYFQQGAGINSFVSAHQHCGQLWKLSLPTTNTIMALIQKCRAMYPAQRLFMFKLDYSRWYRWFQLDPAHAVYFAIRWRHHTYLDAAFSFRNRASALCAQRVMWAIIWIFRTRIEPERGVQNCRILCSCPSHCDCGDLQSCGYIDDSINVAPEHLAAYQFNAFVQLCRNLGLKLSTSAGHISPPAPQCVALGLL